MTDTTWHEEIPPGVPAPFGKRWYCVSLPAHFGQPCMHLRSRTAAEACQWLGVTRATVWQDVCRHTSLPMPVLR